jgi:hypothetical protein
VGWRVHSSPNIVALERLVNETAPMQDRQQAELEVRAVRDGPEDAAARDSVTACRKRGPHADENYQL